MAPGEHTYLDYPQWSNDLPEYNNWGMPITSLETSYRLDPSYGKSVEETSNVMGVMATMWAEAIKDINRVNYMFFPRGLAIAEAGWSCMEQRNWESFKQRIYPNLYDLMRCGVSFRVPFEIAPRR
jgi:hexosaminidase